MYAPGSLEQFERMRPGSPLDEVELVSTEASADDAATAERVSVEVMTYREALRLALGRSSSATRASS